MLKKLKAFLIMILIVPFAFMFSACKNGKGDGGKDNGGSKPPATEPGEGGGDVDPDNPEVVVENFTVNVEYRFPEKFEFLAEDISVSKQTTETYTLPTIDVAYSDYFDCWCDASTDEPLSSNIISGLKDEVKTVYAKWKIDFERYFSLGITFEFDHENDKAWVSGYDGTSQVVVIPQLYKNADLEIYSVAGVKADAFKSNTNVKQVVTYAGGLEIGDSAFENSAVESFDFLTVSKLGNKAFAGTSVSSAVFAATFEELETAAFADCIKLESVDLSAVQNQITDLSSHVFDGCLKLKTVKLAPSIEVIKAYAFADCELLENADFISTDAITTIENYAFSGCLTLNNVVFGKNVVSIGNGLFNGCLSLKNLSVNVLPSSGITSKFSDYFGSLSTVLENLTLTGNAITSINSEYFANYSSLKTFVMNDEISAIGDYAFAGCVNLEEITFSEGLDLANFKLNAFEETKWYLKQSVLVVDNVLIAAPSASGKVVIPAGVQVISESVFAQNSNITSVVVPSSVITISKNAFQNCVNLESVIFEENSQLTAIGLRAFNKCSKLSSINLEVCINLEQISGYAFSEIATSDGVSVEEFKIPASVKTLGNCAFAKSGIEKFIIDSASVSYASDDYGVIYLIDGSKQKTTVVAYPAASANTVYVMPETVSAVGACAFAIAHNLDYIIVESELVSYASDAFSNCYYKISILNKTNTLNAGATTYTTVYNYLDSSVYTFTANESSFDFEIDAASVSQANYYIEFEYNSKKYVYLLKISIENDVVTVLEAVDVSNIVE